MGTNVITDNTAGHGLSKSTPYPEAYQAKVSSLKVAVTTVATNTTLDGSNDVVLANTTAAAITITLPSAVNYKGILYTIKRITAGSYAATLVPATDTDETIDGATSYALSAQYKFVSVTSDGANWFIVAAN